MPGLGLPKAIEGLICSLLEENGLSSWKVWGGGDLVTLTLRFGAGHDTSHGGQYQARSYRKKPPSAVARDQRRQKGRADKISSNQGSDNRSAFRSSNDICSATQTDPHDIAVVGVSVSEAEQAQHTAQASGQLPQHSHVEEVNSDQLTVDPGLPTESEPSMSGFSCDGCDQELPNMSQWIKCTVCDEFDVCNTCYDKKIHSIHKSSMRIFRHPGTSYTVGYCDACGLKFKTGSDAQYYLCQECPNNALCTRCRYQPQ